MVGQAIVNHTRIPFQGGKKVSSQFLILGQEPDEFLGGFDKEQVLKGKISQVCLPFQFLILEYVLVGNN